MRSRFTGHWVSLTVNLTPHACSVQNQNFLENHFAFEYSVGLSNTDDHNSGIFLFNNRL